ncbi:MAG: hypothetical protein ACXVPU_01620 [Bacteroidia bacterium]
MKNILDDHSELKTLVECTNMLDKHGFTTQFKAVETGLQSLKTNRIYSPHEVKVLNFYRFEGSTDPQDSSILYAIETTNNERGTLTDAYGPYGDTLVANFMKQVEDIEKKTDKEKIL